MPDYKKRTSMMMRETEITVLPVKDEEQDEHF